MSFDTVLTDEETFMQAVKVPLTDKELLAYADELTDCDSKESQLVTQQKAINDDFKSQIGEVKSRAGMLMNLLKVKEEYKDIECVNRFNWFDGIVEITRLDNQEVVKTRKITAEEYQQNLPLEKNEN